MSKLLQGRLPFETDPVVAAGTYNKTVRLLELSLDAFDPDKTPQFTASELDEIKFQRGDIIWNSSVNNLQVWSGTEFINITDPETSGLSGTGQIGTVQVITNGSLVVSLCRSYVQEARQQLNVNLMYIQVLMQMLTQVRFVQERLKILLA